MCVTMFVAMCLMAGQAAWAASQPRFILFDVWPVPDVDDLATYIDHPASKAFDGAVIRAGESQIFRNSRIPRESHVQRLEVLRSLKLKERGFDVFLILLADHSDQPDWFDDAAWGNILGNAGDIAWLARQGGAKGILLDPENYGQGTFRYKPRRGQSFEDTYRQVRLRGGQFMKALGDEYPDITLISLWFMSMFAGADLPADAQPPYQMGGGYDLFPAFINGLLDELPAQATLVDGCENTYTARQEVRFLQEYHHMRSLSGTSMRLVAPENRDKYQTRLQAGFGIYTDMFFNPPGKPYSFGFTEDASRLQAYNEVLTLAGSLSDGYVWVYGEQGRWWPRQYVDDRLKQVQAAPAGGRQWNDALPGIHKAVADAKLPHDQRVARQALEDFSRRKAFYRHRNLVKNHGFEENNPAAVEPVRLDWTATSMPGYWMWQRSGRGTVTWDNRQARSGKAAALFHRIEEGCLVHAVKAIKPGQTYIVEAYARQEGAASVVVRVSWKDRHDVWTGGSTVLTFGEPDERGWRQALGVVQAPEQATQMILLPSVGGQHAEAKVWFDDLGVYERQAPR